MSTGTKRKLQVLAKRASTTERKLTPMQVAAQLLEQSVADCCEQ
ncbi:MAG TPA: hypothetical protein VGM03_04490 [Phycisphaerae bacterium]|jgi:hypothetical protein